MLARILLLIVGLLIAVVLILLLSDPIRREAEKNSHKKAVYRTLMDVANEEDFYLLNDVAFYIDSDDPDPVIFDHLLFGEKYIYIVQDISHFGGLYGKPDDPKIFLQKENGEVKSIENPRSRMEEQIRILESALGASHDKHLFIGMTVTNRSLLLSSSLRIKDGSNCLFPLSELKETILEAEKDDVKPFDEGSTKDLVDRIKKRSEEVKQDVAKNNKRRRKRR